MNPLYFPYTYINKSSADKLMSCFKQIIVYQPSVHKVPLMVQQLAEQGVLDIRFPVSGEEELLDRMIREYQRWAEQHQGSELSIFKVRQDAIPFFDEDSPSQIRAELKGKKSSLRENTSKNVLFQARLFLQIAQEYDMDQEELRNNLESVEQLEQKLFKGLKGEDVAELSEVKPLKKISADEAADYMLLERMDAWSLLMQNDPQPSGVFVTTSKSAFERVLDSYSNAIPIAAYAIPSENQQWKLELADFLHTLCEHPNPAAVPPPQSHFAASADSAALTLYLIPGVPPKYCFSKKPTIQTETQTHRNTLLGLIS